MAGVIGVGEQLGTNYGIVGFQSLLSDALRFCASATFSN